MNLRAKTDGNKFSEKILKSKTCSLLKGSTENPRKRKPKHLYQTI